MQLKLNTMKSNNFVCSSFAMMVIFLIYISLTNTLKGINSFEDKTVLINSTDTAKLLGEYEPQDYDLPAWCDNHRVQLHTRLWPEMMESDSSLFFGAASLFQEVGVVTFTRHIKSRGEGAWWPSKVGATLPIVKEGRNVAKEIIDSAHKEGMHIIAYHRHMEDDYMAEKNPDWVCKNCEGEYAENRRGWMMCFNSPYQDYFFTRCLELIDLGIDGFYFDEVHMPKKGCWCKYCQEKFKKETGLNPPAKWDVQDSLWWKYRDFMNLTIERTFRRYSKAFLEKNPNLVLVIASNTWPRMNDPQTTSSLYHIPGVINKTEFIKGRDGHKGELYNKSGKFAGQYSGWYGLFRQPEESRNIPESIGQIAGYAISRDAADGRPAHVWTQELCNEQAALAITASIVGHGCIANLDMKESLIPRQDFASSFALGEKVSKYYADAKPLPYLAILFSERTRDAYWNDNEQAWTKVLHPIYGVYQTMTEHRWPVSFITDCQLEEGLLNDYKVIFVPDESQLSFAMKASISSFQKEGGKVIYNNQKWDWTTETGYEKAQNYFIEILHNTKVSPITVTGGPDIMQTDFFWNSDKKRLTISCINDCLWVKPCSWVDITTQKAPKPISGVTIELQDRLSHLSPKRIIEAVSGRELMFKEVNNKIYITVPEFQYLATVMVQY